MILKTFFLFQAPDCIVRQSGSCTHFISAEKQPFGTFLRYSLAINWFRSVINDTFNDSQFVLLFSPCNSELNTSGCTDSFVEKHKRTLHPVC